MPSTETKRNQMIIDYLIQHLGCDGIVHYTVSGKSVCETCWRLVCGLRYNKFSTLKKIQEWSVESRAWEERHCATQ